MAVSPMRCAAAPRTIPSAYVARVLVPIPDFDVDVDAARRAVTTMQTVEFESIEPAGGEGTNRWFRVEVARAHRRAAVRALFESRGSRSAASSR